MVGRFNRSVIPTELAPLFADVTAAGYNAIAAWDGDENMLVVVVVVVYSQLWSLSFDRHRRSPLNRLVFFARASIRLVLDFSCHPLTRQILFCIP